MAQYSHFAFKQQGPQYLKDNVTLVLLVVNPLKADSYAALVAKAIASEAYDQDDVVITASGEDCLTTLAAKADVDPSGTAASGDDICLAYVSGTEVILVMDANDRDLTNETGDLINIPEMSLFFRENVSV